MNHIESDAAAHDAQIRDQFTRQAEIFAKVLEPLLGIQK